MFFFYDCKAYKREKWIGNRSIPNYFLNDKRRLSSQMFCKKIMLWFLTALLAANTLLCLPGVAGAEEQDLRDGMKLDQADAAQEELEVPEGTVSFTPSTSATNSVYNALMMSLAAVDNTTLVINPGETYEFENIDTAGRAITSNASAKNDITYDLVTYKADHAC
jgi:hypothetical protein